MSFALAPIIDHGFQIDPSAVFERDADVLGLNLDVPLEGRLDLAPGSRYGATPPVPVFPGRISPGATRRLLRPGVIDR